MRKLIEFLRSGCWHKRLSFPQRPARSLKPNHVVCLDCGKELPYTRVQL